MLRIWLDPKRTNPDSYRDKKDLRKFLAEGQNRNIGIASCSFLLCKTQLRKPCYYFWKSFVFYSFFELSDQKSPVPVSGENFDIEE